MVGKLADNLFAFVAKKSLIVAIPISVPILAYMETASAVKMRALSGIAILFRSSMMLSEFLM